MGEGHSESHEIKQGLVMNKDMLDKQSLQLDINEERERSFMLSSLLNGLPGGVAIFKFGEKMECQYYSDGFAKISDRTREEIDELLQQERLLEEVIAPSDMDRFLDKIESSVAVGAPINMTYRYIIKNKGIGWLHVSASKLREEDGYPVYYCIFTNPTDETALYQSIVEDSAIGVFVAERKTKRILYMNERIGQLFGVPQERMKQRINNFERLSKEYEQLSNEEVMSLKEDGYKEFHVVWGEKLHLGINAKAINWNGMDAYILYFTDETGEYEHQRQLQRLIDEVPGGIGIYELRAGKVSLLYLNDAYYRHLGWNRESRKQYMGTNAMEAVHPDDREKFDAAAKKIVDGADHVDVLHRVCNKDGMWIWLKYSAAVVERKGDLIRLYVSFSDCNEMMLTQQKMMKAQMELQANRAMLDAALSSAQVMTWKYDIEKKIITDSGTFGAVFGMPKVILNVPDAFIELGMVHTQSIDDFRWLYAHAGDGKIIQKDICLKSKEKNTFIWERIIFSPVFDSVGECIEAVGTSVDITEQKEREQHYEEQLRLKKLASQGTLATATYNLTKNIVTEYDSSRPELLKIMQDTTVDEMLENIRKNTITDEEKKFASAYDTNTLIKIFADGISHVEIPHHLNTSSNWVKSTFDIIQNPYSGDIEAIANLWDISDTVRAELVVNRLLSVDYESIMTFDVKTGQARSFRKGRANDVRQEMFSMLNAKESTDKGVTNFYTKYAIPEDRERACRENSPETVIQALENTSVYISLFSLQTGDKVAHKRVMYAYLDESKDTILCAVQDVTNTYEAEEKQRKDLERALEVAEGANRSKRDFLSRMSHDMRTPMNGIIGVAQLSAQMQDAGALRENMDKIKESGEYLLSLINDTLDFQRIESGNLSLNIQVVHTMPIFQNIIDIIKPAAEEKGVEFKVLNRNADMDWYIRIDPVRIKQIFINLLSNAVKFTNSGGIVCMEVQNLSRDNMISHNCIKISDTGIGMSEEFLKNELYKPFSQERSKVTSQYAGSGLGLSIVHSLVEMMGGQMEVESQRGVGTTFTLYLNFERVGKEEVQKIENEAKSKAFVLNEELMNKKILLVEDHPLNAQIAAKLLNKAGCEMTWVDNGEKGVQAFADSDIGSYDAVLMDIRMPVTDGLKATSMIRALERKDAKTIPIIAMTANAFDEDVKKSVLAGMNAHLSKPIRPELLYETLVDCILDANER